MTSLAKSVGMRLVEMSCDSTEYEFIGSEQYVRDIPLKAENSYMENPRRSIFSEQQLQFFKQEAIRVNRERRGGRAQFLFRAD